MGWCQEQAASPLLARVAIDGEQLGIVLPEPADDVSPGDLRQPGILSERLRREVPGPIEEIDAEALRRPRRRDGDADRAAGGQGELRQREEAAELEHPVALGEELALMAADEPLLTGLQRDLLAGLVGPPDVPPQLGDVRVEARRLWPWARAEARIAWANVSHSACAVRKTSSGRVSALRRVPLILA